MRISRIGMIVIFVLFNPCAVWAQGVIGIHGEPTGQALCVMPSLPVQEYYVVYTGGPPIQSVEFSAPIPVDCLTPSSQWIDDVAVFPNTVGDSQNGVVVDFGQCFSPPIHVLTIQVVHLPIPEPDCCPWEIEGALAIDCNGQSVSWSQTRGYLNSYVCNPVLPPHTPSPPDGATSVSLAANLEWQWHPGPVGCELGDVLVFTISWGIDPNNLTTLFDQGPPFPVPGGLQPNTQYYWQAASTTYNGAGPFPGPLWSFTTEGSVATEARTWGRIKALYR
jgi:hypothetical protein